MPILFYHFQFIPVDHIIIATLSFIIGCLFRGCLIKDKEYEYYKKIEELYRDNYVVSKGRTIEQRSKMLDEIIKLEER